MKNYLLYIITALFLLNLVGGCTQVRTEFYRNETSHLYEEGVQLYKQGEYENSRNNFEDIILLDPDYGPAHAALGNLAMIREDYRVAFIHYNEAITNDPELQEDLLPLLLNSDSYQQRAPLLKAGISLAQIYELVLAEEIVELNDLLVQELPLELLAKDTLSLTPGQFGELRQKAAEIALFDDFSLNSQLLFGYILFYSDDYNNLVGTLLEKINKDPGVTKLILQESLILLGRLQERSGKKNSAVDSFLAAVDAGKTMEDVAHYLARIYGVDIETILPDKEQNITIAVPKPEPVSFQVSSAEPTESQVFSIKDSGAEDAIKTSQVVIKNK